MSEEPYTIRIVCDMRAHPHHKGKDVHITVVEYMEFGHWLESGGWVTSRAETWREFPNTDGTFRRSPKAHATYSTRPDGVGGANVKRYELECHRCGLKVAARRDRSKIDEIFDRARQEKRRELPLIEISRSLSGPLG